jgi:hypothetical protein
LIGILPEPKWTATPFVEADRQWAAVSTAMVSMTVPEQKDWGSPSLPSNCSDTTLDLAACSPVQPTPLTIP